ncbi:hypothetical protein [Actinokineospora cianjurensis]|uniref:Uncharacterized protein n=1 Tax=Actinokineospora cianjurensis TaxID=585224 RepID=A0A421B5X9_9PSEU|nr:hypothetical protein [Actinokineospora cianjurensis]RLK59749.1 hypothetical protein CLV68_0233 [Actinokineospora cianjurensis]
MPLPYPPGARLLARPEAVEPCPTCADPLGRGYRTCPTCADPVDALWKADWDALPADDELPATVLAAPVGTHAWTCVDWAMRLLSCPVCRTELGTGPACLHCAKSDQARWAWDHTAPAGAMTANEHAIRMAVAALRGAGERRDTVIAFWRLALPHLLVGAVPTQAQVGRIRVHLIAGRHEELDEAPGFAEMAALADLPWRSA